MPPGKLLMSSTGNFLVNPIVFFSVVDYCQVGSDPKPFMAWLGVVVDLLSFPFLFVPY